MNRILALVVMAFLAAVGRADAQAPAGDRWLLLGSMPVSAGAAKDRFDLVKNEGKWRAVRVVDQGGRVALDQVVITYDDGRTHLERRHISLQAGERTRPIDPREDARKITSIEFAYAADNPQSGSRRLEIWGLQGPDVQVTPRKAVSSATPAAAAGQTLLDVRASPDDTARFLAGLPPSSSSPLVPLTQEAIWLEHSRQFETAWQDLERRQLAPIRAWTARYLTAPRPTLFYMFSGPDFLYANAFFPKAATYVLSGLEPVGAIPDLLSLKGALPSVLRNFESALSQVLTHSYFITKEMGSKFGRTQLNGTLPVLYAFLARSGKTIREVTPMVLETDGVLKPVPDSLSNLAARAVKIAFADADGRVQTLYYFRTNLANDGVADSGFLKFCDQLGVGDNFIKSASYLLHANKFATVRDFILMHSANLLQDDTGVPVSYLNSDTWHLQPFGTYDRPIGLFRRNYQSKLKDLYKGGEPAPIEFGVGYKWRLNQSNLLLAVKRM